VATQVIVLNSGSSSGKSGIARCLQAILPDPWLAFGTDNLIQAMPASLQTSAAGIEFAEDGDPIGTALEWGVRVLKKPVTVHAEGDRPEPATADIFPAYDDDGGLLLVLTPN
jgi:chloramphenicol 3-O-phosphotransferase